MATLRPYQVEAVESVEREWSEGRRKTLLVCATGTGKTVIFSKIIENRVREGERCLILAHRGELLDQAQSKLKMVTGLNSVIEKAEDTALGKWERVTVGSVQSLMQEKRLQRFDPSYYDTIIVDEAHHALSPSYQKVLAHFEDAKVLGVTATPDRGDFKELGTFFDSLAYEYPIHKGIREGYLSPIKALSIPLQIDLKGVKTQAGDFQASAVSHALEPYLESIAKEMQTYCKDRKTVVFMPLIDTSQKFVEILKLHDFRAVEVNGTSDERDTILEDFEKGFYDVIVNAMLLTEGWDCPSVDTVVVLRPTKVRALYSQMVGRGTRLYPGKEHLLLLDFLWMTDKHDLCRPASIIAKDADVLKKAEDLLEEQTGEEFDLEELIEEAESDVVAERESALAKALEEMRKKKKKLVDPIQYAVSINAEDLTDYKPSFGWEFDVPSIEQLKALETFGIDATSVGSKGEATLMIDRLKARKSMGLATPKQIRLLERYHFKRVGTWTQDQASAMISRLSLAGWRIPFGVKPSEYEPKKEDDSAWTLAN